MREWRQEFPEQTRRAIIRIHTNLGHPQNSTLAKMISDAGGSEEMINVQLGTRVLCASECPVFWNYQGHEVLVYSLIDEATRFHVTQIVPSKSARDLHEAIMNA